MRRSLYPLALLALAILLGMSACRPEARPLSAADSTLYRACDYLWKAQSEDGAWRSKTHALMQGGESMSPFVAWALLNVPDSLYPAQEGKQKALAFLRSRVNAQGTVGLGDPDIMEYPNYSTAYTLRVLSTFGDAQDRELIERMKGYLLDQQFVEHRGIMPTHLAYGCWGFGEKLHKDSITGHVDLSVTRRVLQALKSTEGVPAQTYGKAKAFLSLLQKHPSDLRRQPDTEDDGRRPLYDGGFYYSPIATAGNKAKQEPGDSAHAAYYRSYATATCDGILSLIACGQPVSSEPVQSALKWLAAHPELDRPGGIPLDDPDEWHAVMKYYHLCVRSEALGAAGAPGTWGEDIARIWQADQQPDGSFSNPYGARNKEDDPLLATAFAVISLQCIRSR